MTLGSAQRTNATAVVALLAGIFGFCFWGVGGILAVILGVVARGEIARSDGRETGEGMALTGIVLGALNIGSGLIVTAVSIALLISPGFFSSTPSPPHVAAAPPPPLPTATTTPTPGKAAGDGTRPRATFERGVHEIPVGKLRLVDMRPEKGGLRRALEEESKAAGAAGERLVLFLVNANCLPCNGVGLSLRDARMQRALEAIRLIRVDVDDYAGELVGLGVPNDAIPGFALLAENLRLVDFVHGGEWDADIPENIAKVLGPFVRGKYAQRRHQFRAPGRAGETTL